MQTKLLKGQYVLEGRCTELGYFGALAFNPPITQFQLMLMEADSVMSWLSSEEGPTWIEDEREEKNLNIGLLLYFSPYTLYGTREGKDIPPDFIPSIGVGLVYKPAYLATTSFKTALAALYKYKRAGSSQKGSPAESKKLSSQGVMILNIHKDSSFIPLARPSSVFLDYAEKRMLEGISPFPTNYRGFNLYEVIWKESPTDESMETSIYIPRCHEQRALLEKTHTEKMDQDARESSLRSPKGDNAVITVRLRESSGLHWNLVEDKTYPLFLATMRKIQGEARMIADEAHKIELAKRKVEGESQEKPSHDVDIELVENDEEATFEVNVNSSKGSRISSELKPASSEQGASGRQSHPARLIGSKPRDSPDVVEAKRIVTGILQHQLLTFHELGRIRELDRTLAEGLLAEHARVSSMVSEDAVRSLMTSRLETREMGKRLFKEVSQLMEPTRDKRLRYNIEALITRHQDNIEAATWMPIVLFDSAQKEMKAFLERRLRDISSDRETQMMVDECVESFTNHTATLSDFLSDPAMATPGVANRVQVGLITSQPLVNNYFSGLLEGVLGVMGFKPGGKESQTGTVVEGVSRQYARLLKDTLSEATGGYETDWEDAERDLSVPSDLHLGYMKDFSVRLRDKVHPAFDTTLINEILAPLEELHLEEKYVNKQPRLFRNKELLWDAYQQSTVCDQDQIKCVLNRAVARSCVGLYGDGGPDDRPEEAPKDAPIGGEEGPEGGGGFEQPKPSGSGSGAFQDPGLQSGSIETGETGVSKKSLERKAGQVISQEEEIPDAKEEEDEDDEIEEGEEGEEVSKPHQRGFVKNVTPVVSLKDVDHTGFSLSGGHGKALKSKSVKAQVAKKSAKLQRPTGTPQSVKRDHEPDFEERSVSKKQKVSSEKGLLPLSAGIQGITITKGKDSKATVVCSLGSAGGATSEELDSLGIVEPSSGVTPAKASQKKKTSDGDKEVKAEDEVPPKSSKKVTIIAPEDDAKPSGSKADLEDEPEEEGGEGGPGEEAPAEDEEDDADEAEWMNSEEFRASLDDHRYALYCRDTENAQKVRNLLLGVDPESRTTRSMIAESDRFHHMSAGEASDKKLPVDDVSEHWQPLLEKGKAFTKCHPDEVVPPPEGVETLYLTKDFIKLNKTSSGCWKAGVTRPRFLIMAHKTRTIDQLRIKEFGFTRFHFASSVKRNTLLVPVSKTKKGKRQFAFCPYCGIRYLNDDTVLSHLRSHLSFEYICGGCYSKTFKSTKTLSDHFRTCGAINETKKKLSSRRSTRGQDK